MVLDLLDSAYSQLRAVYLRCVGQHLQGAATWQAAEAGVFAVRAVNLSLKVLQDIVGREGYGETSAPSQLSTLRVRGLLSFCGCV